MWDKTQSINVMRKFGRIDTPGAVIVDVWDYASPISFYQYIPYVSGNQPQGEDIFISSADNDDTNVIQIEGLDEKGRYQIVTQQLAGQVKTQIPGSWFRIFRAFNTGSTVLEGKIYIYRDTTVTIGVPDVTSKVQAHIFTGARGQTQMSHFTIPFDQDRAWIDSFTLSLLEVVTSYIIFELYTRKPGGVFLLKNSFSLQTSGTGSFDRRYKNLSPSAKQDFQLEPGEDIVWRIVTADVNNGVSVETVIRCMKS